MGDQLVTAALFDFELQSAYSVRVRTTDSGGLFFEKALAITINDLPDAGRFLYGTVGNGFGTSTLVTLDYATGGLLSTIGDIGYLVNGLEYDAVTGTLYATTSLNDLTLPSGLLTIDPATGVATEIGATGLGVVMNIRSDSAGTLYGWTEDTDDLVTIDAATGAATVVGDSGLLTSQHGMSFDGADALYFVNTGGVIARVDPVTGLATLTGGTLGTVAHHGDINIATGEYWGIDTNAPGVKNIVVADLAAGGVVRLLPTVADLHTLAFIPYGTAPTAMALSGSAVDENQPIGTTVGTLTTTDPDAGDTFTYVLVGGVGATDNGSFAIVGDQLVTAAILDFEAQSSYSIRVRTIDSGSNFIDRVFVITVNNVNDAPTDIALAPSSVDENQPIGTTVGTLTTTDQDFGDSFTYTLVAGVGATDNASFGIVGGQLVTAAVFDFEAQASYTVRVRTTDGGGLFFEKAFVITVNDVNEAPTDIALAPTSIDENQPVGTAVGTLTTTDPDAGDTFTYTLVTGAGDTDNASFGIVGGQLVTAAVFDFETQASYSVRVRTTDGGGLTFEKAFVITVNDANDAPTDVALSSSSVDENQPVGTTVGTLTTTDPDSGDTFTYTLVAGAGDTDNASFGIVGGQLVTAAVFDFETQSSYSVRVRTTDGGGLFFEKAFVITVNDVNDAPTDVALTPSSVDENQPIGTTVGTLTTTDQDAGDTFTYALVAGTGRRTTGRSR